MGNNVSGSIASSGKFRKACMSFSNGNFTCDKRKINISRNVGEAAESTKQFITHQVIMAVLQKSQTNFKDNSNTLWQKTLITSVNIFIELCCRKGCISFQVTNLIKKDIPNSQGQMEGKRVRENSNKPLARVHARIYHLPSKMLSKLRQLLSHKVIKLKQVLLHQRKPRLSKKTKNSLQIEPSQNQ